jgi:uncharacterized membrane protein
MAEQYGLDQSRELGIAMTRREFAVGISFLEVLARATIPPLASPGWLLWAPENFLRLVSRAQANEVDRLFLLRVMRSFVSPAFVGDEASPNRITQEDVGQLIKNILFLFESGRLRTIEETDPYLEDLLEGVFPRSSFRIELSPEQNFVARYVGAVLGWSKRTGKAILEGGERVINHMGSMIASLRIPERTGKLLEAKERLSTELLAEFGISKSTTKIVAMASAVGGAFLSAATPLGAAVGVIGLWLSFTDP